LSSRLAWCGDMELGQLLQHAAYVGDVAGLRRLAAQGVDVNVQLGELRQTALHEAAFYGRVEAIRVLVELGADFEALSAAGWTPLHAAAASGQVEAIQALVELGVNKEATDLMGLTPLHAAASMGHVEAIQALAQLGVNIEAKSAYGGTPLHLAAAKGHVEAIKTLAQLGAELEPKTVDGETPLQLTIDRGHPQAARVLGELLHTCDAASPHAPVDMEPTTAASQTSVCAACGNTSGASGAALKTCARCRSSKYCCVACQRSHWPVHKRCCAAAAPSSS